MISSDLADKMQEYLAGAISLEDLGDWLAPKIPFYLQNHPSEDSDLVGTFELGLAEIDDDIATEEDLRNALSEVLAEPKVIGSWISFDSELVPQIVTGSANETSSQSYTLDIPSGVHVQSFDCAYV